ncbi:VOC family protein [Halobacterium salinarum]|uniref:Catechol-2,3-dioxygenase n=1 Tax=Halobacterium salinarum (strain ATCC 33171 / DSM 3754 / JCM 8978 / NBRC 102687 / NCIMB 764 / 91-R6) TaxID=2597657 RepID=A0A4D6GT80_HALS9|nr:VOC family protein [Halobacterium salinarum]QCC44893.1 glyoxalase domain protein [Halobacterium salinarum]TYO75523.1 Catechol-2,3-dioxygenase [Halobacterium salinarum DSM 3754]
MLSTLSALALEVHHLGPAADWYETHLGLDGDRSEHEARYQVGETTLVLREPSTVPRGGLHVHYALATPEDRYDDWFAHLQENFDPVEFDFGSARSLYVDDPDGHCVEIGTGGSDGDDPLTGVFEVALEVEDLARAEAFYGDLGFEVVDRGDGRERTRLSGPMALELWEPQRGIADARGAVHADLRFATPDPEAAAEAVAERACRVDTVGSGDGTGGEPHRVRDPDGHYLTFHAE